MQPLERDQAAVLTLFTDIVCGPPDDAVALASVLLERPVFLHELGSGPVADEVREIVRPLFEAMAANVAMAEPTWPGDERLGVCDGPAHLGDPPHPPGEACAFWRPV